MIRLKDVAKKANVSPATASLALNDNDLVNDKTKARIKKIAKEMNYILDARAKALKTKETKIIGLVIPEIDNPFFSEIAKEIKNVAKKNGYNIIYCGVESEKDELDYISLFRGMQVDGAIFASSFSTSNMNIDLIKELADNFIPVVFIDRLLDSGDLIDSVNSDLKKAAFIAVEHLYKLGHKKMGRKAIKLLLKKIKNKDNAEAKHIKFDVSLIERETTQKPV